MKGKQLMAVIFIATVTSSCSITGPADDGFENSLESVDIGTIQAMDLLKNLRKNSGLDSAGTAPPQGTVARSVTTKQ